MTGRGAVPVLDRAVGITAYSTDAPGSGGRIRERHGDFAVEETISEKSAALIRDAGRYAVYRLTKRGIDTAHAVSSIRRSHRLRLKVLGLKDASAHTTQYACAAAAGAGIGAVRTPKYDLDLLGYTERPLTKRAMTGNRFRITVRGHTGRLEMPDRAILNHYGYQRFGSGRPITHLVGKAVVLGDFEEAVRLILYEASPFDSPRNVRLRRSLEGASRRECLRMLPRGMDTERTVARALLDGGDARGAFTAVPLYLRRLYVLAYQSYLFNLTLGAALRDGAEMAEPRDGDVCFDPAARIGKWDGGAGSKPAVPLVGYSYYKKTRFHGAVREVLDAEGVSPKMFYLKRMQELSSEGGFRQAVLGCSEFSATRDRVEFVLSRGSYATMVMREIIKPRDPAAAGF